MSDGDLLPIGLALLAYMYLAPSDYYLFLNLKIWLQGKKFYSNEEVEWEIEEYFEGLSSDHYKKGIEMLKDRWTRTSTGCRETAQSRVKLWMRRTATPAPSSAASSDDDEHENDATNDGHCVESRRDETKRDETIKHSRGR
ncbi:hypothetical protein ACLKA7_012015 [Drosophila subpalustris]